MVAADARTAITFALSPGNAHDPPEGRELLRDPGSFPGMPVIMDRAYEGNETRQLVLELEMVPVVPPKSNRVDPWRYDRALYKKRNEIERLFRRSRVTAASSPALRNWIVCSLRFSPSSKHSDSVNTP
jgi:transposase